MKKLIVLGICLILFSCAPVLNRDLMKQGVQNVSFDQLKANPDAHKGKLFILGGIIVETRFIEKGSQIEVLSLSVTSSGYIKERERSMGRFLAISPTDRGLLDPVVYKKGRDVTLAGEFIELRRSKIDDFEYVYPVFEIKEIHLWEEERDYMFPYPYYPYTYYPHPNWYNPYWGPWPPPPGWY